MYRFLKKKKEKETLYKLVQNYPTRAGEISLKLYDGKDKNFEVDWKMGKRQSNKLYTVYTKFLFLVKISPFIFIACSYFLANQTECYILYKTYETEQSEIFIGKFSWNESS